MRLFKKTIWPGLAVCLVSASCFWPHLSPADESGGSTTAVGVALPAAAGVEEHACSGPGCRRIEEGDLVTIDYSAFLEDGRLIYTTRAQDAKDGALLKVGGYQEQAVYASEEVAAGKAARFPGVGQSLVGMAAGERKRITLPADKAFGPSDPQMIKSFPATKILDSVIRMSPSDYVKQFGSFPAEGKEVNINPYLLGRVSRVAETYAELAVTAGDMERFDEEFGTVEVRRQGNQFKVTLSPKIGAPFRTETEQGRIIAADAGSFTVDFNPPLAGRPVVADIQVLKVTRASELTGVQIPWIEDHDEGLASAKATGRPAVLVLYADWCQWCKKLLTESFPDPRIRELKDRLVWIKVNSDRLKGYGTKYEQKSFPTIVFFRPDGTIARKIEGYLDAAALREALGILIDGREARAS